MAKHQKQSAHTNASYSAGYSSTPPSAVSSSVPHYTASHNDSLNTQHRNTRTKGPLTADQLQPGKTYVESTTLGHDILSLLLKIVVIVLAFVLLFTFVFGVVRQPNGSMNPAVNDGDALLIYHLDKDYVAGDVIVVNENDTVQALRVVAVAGDTVDITQEGLLINGNLQSSQSVVGETKPFKEGVTFPLTVGPQQVFVLGDTREQATDSRIFGCVDVNETQGSVISLLRRRGI